MLTTSQAIHRFVDDKSEEKRNAEGESRLGKRGGLAASAAAALDAEEARRERRRAEERAHWDRLGEVVSERTTRAWGALERAQDEYLDVLRGRQRAVDDVARLSASNAQLKALLSQYLGAPVNDELIVPPSQVIRVDAGGGRR